MAQTRESRLEELIKEGEANVERSSKHLKGTDRLHLRMQLLLHATFVLAGFLAGWALHTIVHDTLTEWAESSDG